MQSLSKLPVNNYDIYVRRKEDCHEINTEHGELIYEYVGIENGNTKKHSIAEVNIASEGSSTAHLHPDSEESYIFTQGIGRLVINGENRIVKTGDVVKIPMGIVHQIFNNQAEDLKFYCVCAPAWHPECFVPVEDKEEMNESGEAVYIKRKEDCQEIDTGQGELIYEFIGVENGNAVKHSVAQVELLQGGSSQAHLHPEAEESYIILEGKGRIVIDGKEKIVTPGDVVNIGVGKVHKIFNNFTETLKFYVVCAPAWTPSCAIYI